MIHQFRKWVVTIVLTVATLGLSLVSDFFLDLPKEFTWITIFIGTMLTITVTLIDFSFNDALVKQKNQISRDLSSYSKLYDIFNSLHDEHLQNQVFTLLNSLKKGEIPAFLASSFTRHLMVNSMSTCYSIYPIRNNQELYNWIDYPRHKTWLNENYLAIKRGVKVERTFILKKNEFYPDGQWNDKAYKVLNEQYLNGIFIRIIWFEDFEKAPTHLSFDQTFTILDGIEIIHDEGKGNNRIYRNPSIKVQEFNDIWNEHLKYSFKFPTEIIQNS